MPLSGGNAALPMSPDGISPLSHSCLSLSALKSPNFNRFLKLLFPKPEGVVFLPVLPVSFCLGTIWCCQPGSVQFRNKMGNSLTVEGWTQRAVISGLLGRGCSEQRGFPVWYRLHVTAGLGQMWTTATSAAFCELLLRSRALTPGTWCYWKKHWPLKTKGILLLALQKGKPLLGRTSRWEFQWFFGHILIVIARLSFDFYQHVSTEMEDVSSSLPGRGEKKGRVW